MEAPFLEFFNSCRCGGQSSVVQQIVKLRRRFVHVDPAFVVGIGRFYFISWLCIMSSFAITRRSNAFKDQESMLIELSTRQKIRQVVLPPP